MGKVKGLWGSVPENIRKFLLLHGMDLICQTRQLKVIVFFVRGGIAEIVLPESPEGSCYGRIFQEYL